MFNSSYQEDEKALRLEMQVSLKSKSEKDSREDNELESQFAQTLRQEIMQEFPELPMFKMHRTPIGPHTLGMFEVDIFTPAQLGDEFKDHTQNAIWIGESVPLNLDFLRKSKDMDEVAKRMQQLTAN
ncbi:MAG: hypothetical protein LQ352_003704 [Teloschistes flavicans]|nr:MAG: hypothetical protein LQ352_003704 [Teloschistes flavicans]